MKTQNDKIKRVPLIFPINLQSFSETASGQAPEEIQVLPVGKWNHPGYGPIVITREDISVFKDNFEKNLRRDIPITEGHEVMDEKPAVGWFKELIDRGANGLFATIEWTEKGKTLLAEKSYKYFSPEFYSEYEDPETRVIHENVLVGGALTNKPYFKELKAVVMSEKIIEKQQLTFNENTMKLQDLLAKKAEDLSVEEKAFVKEHASELTDEQKETFKSVVEETPETPATPETPETPETPVTPTPEAPAPVENPAPKARVEASEQFKTDDKGNVVMTMAEAKALSNKANAGFEASEKLRKSEIKAEASKLVFSEQNSNGRILPKHEAKVLAFMEGLNDKQRAEFSELVSAIPAVKMFGENGSGASAEGSAFSEVEAKTKKLMSENKGMSYADAVNKVFSENAELAKRYTEELK